MYKYLLHIVCTICIGPCLAIAAENPDTVTDRYISMALQGDLSGAETLFDGVGTGPLVTDLAHRFKSRFVIQDGDLSPHTGDALVDAIVSTYRMYWIETLTGRLTPQEGLVFLENALHRLLNPVSLEDQTGARTESRAGNRPEFPDVLAQMGSALEERGFHYLETNAPPLQDLFLWKREENKKFTVRLTDRSQPVRVTFMSEIYSMGWKQFATLGLVATTGWVKGERLYCVSGAYDRLSEDFRVSYLKHESRHLADFKRFPGLPSVELEYRAKLTELAFATASLRGLLEDFTLKSSPNSGSPHTFANYRVTRDMYEVLYEKKFPVSGNPWVHLDVSATNQAAQDLLEINTEILELGEY